MKQTFTFLFCLLLSPLFLLAQNEFYNDGASVYVQSAGLIYVQGEVINDDQGGNIGRMYNSGDIQLEGNWTNTSTSNVFQANDPGTTTFLGNNALQTIGGTSDTYFNNLTLNKPGGVREVRMLRPSLCDQVLALNDDFLNTQTFIFGVTNPNPASITRLGATAPNIVNTTTEGYVTSTPGSTGRLARTTSSAFPGATYFFPVGTSARFRPVAVTPTSIGTNVYGVQFVDIPTPNTGSRAPTLATINPNWYHFIERAVPFGSPEDIRIYWSFVDDDICDLSQLTLSEWNTALWADLSTVTNTNPGAPFLGYTHKSGYPGTYPTPWVTESFALAGLFISPGISSCVFPVEMIALEATGQTDHIRLDWSTASESNNAGFQVFRSTDGHNFDYQGFVNGSGTSVEQKDYLFRDRKVQPGQLYYYRLHQIDFNGNASPSNIVSAIISENGQPVASELYPVPATDELFLNFYSEEATQVDFLIVNSLGQTVLHESAQFESGSQIHSFNIRELAKGTYFLKIQMDGNSVVRRFVKD